MFGLLLKLFILVAIVGGVALLVSRNKSLVASLSNPENLKVQVRQQVSNFDTAKFTSNLGSSLDSLVTHSDSNSPVVLGVKISNDSLNTVVDVLQNLPPEQIDQIKSALCAPSPTPAE